MESGLEHREVLAAKYRSRALAGQVVAGRILALAMIDRSGDEIVPARK